MIGALKSDSADNRGARRPHRYRRVAARHPDGARGAENGRSPDRARRTRISTSTTTAISRSRDMAELADAPPDNAKHYREIQRWTRALSGRAYELARSGAIPIFLGGDHTLSMGSVNGDGAPLARSRAASSSCCGSTRMRTTTRPRRRCPANMHGMSAAFLCGEPGLDGLLGEEPRASIDPDRLELFGMRSIDKLEKDLLRERRISVADMRADRRVRRRRADAPCHRQGAGPQWRAACQFRRRFSRSRALRPASAPRCPAGRPIGRRIW